MKRAVYLHNQICSLLLTSYENLQDHIIKMSTYLNEYERKNLKFGMSIIINFLIFFSQFHALENSIFILYFSSILEYVNCKEKLHKICEIIQVRKYAFFFIYKF